MIRNVVVGRLKPHASTEHRDQLVSAIESIGALDLPGMCEMHVGLDRGLRAGGWSFAITNDWVDDDAYRNYDQNPEHNQYRQMVVEVCDHIARVQFEI